MAAAWFARRDAGGWGEADQRELESWLAADPAHALAWSRLELMWSSLKSAPDDIAEAARADVKKRKRKRAASLGAAGVALSLVLAAVLVFDVPTRLAADVVTAEGERRELVLEDGSRVVLDTGTAIALHYGANERRVTLLRGRAAFEVEADVTRRFVVDVDGVTTTALGTAFVVRRRNDGIHVLVTEHAVAFASHDATTALVVEEGQGARWTRDGGALESVDLYAATAWRRGLLLVEDQSLSDVVSEIDRYFPGFIVVTDDVRDIRVSGVFNTDDPNAALDLLARTFDLKLARAGDAAILISR